MKGEFFLVPKQVSLKEMLNGPNAKGMQQSEIQGNPAKIGAEMLLVASSGNIALPLQEPVLA